LANATILEQKQKIVADLAESIKNASSGVLVNYQGITVADDTALRKQLREAGVEYSVIKNTLISKACDIVGYQGLKADLEGMTAIAISKDDAVVAAKILCDFAAKNEKFQVKSGFVDGEVVDKKGIEALAATPSKEQLISTLMGSVQAPYFKLVLTLRALIEKNGGEPADNAEQA